MMNLEISLKEPHGVLTLLALRGVGPQMLERLSRRFHTLEEIRTAKPQELEFVPVGVRTALGDPAAWDAALAYAQKILDEADRHRVVLLTETDTRYPEWLRATTDRPPVLFLKGTLRPGLRYVACIGTREPSEFGEKVSRRIATALGEQGWSIVSGLALGVDTLSHRAALDCGAHTVAVLGNGLESIYPKKNTQLALDILSAGGALLSEQPFDTPVMPRNLVQRDRLQSGMSAGTVVMQTDIVGGSMHTVRFTLQQKRLLFAPMPPPSYMEEPKNRGILALIRNSGPELARILDAKGEFSLFLERQFRNRPVATAITGREDYEKLFAELERAVTSDISHRNESSGLFSESKKITDERTGERLFYNDEVIQTLKDLRTRGYSFHQILAALETLR